MLVVGAGPRSAGGVWSAVSTLLGSSLREEFSLRHVATHRDGSHLAKLAAAAQGIVKIARALAVREVDLMWVHTSADASFRRKAVVVALVRLARVPLMLHVHAGEFDRYYEAAGRPERAVIRRVLGAADLVVALAPVWERRLRAMGARHTTSIPNPVVVPAVGDGACREAGRIVFLGRYGEAKGTSVLVEAVGRLARDVPGVTLVMAGDGDAAAVRAEVRRLGIEDRVQTLPWVAHEEAARLLDTSAVFALPSRAEGLPMALLEAMARALPVVVTPVGGIPELVRDGEHGLFVAPDDPAGLAEALGRLVGDPDEARRLGQAGRRRVERTCAVPVVVAEVARALRECLRRRAPA